MCQNLDFYNRSRGSHSLYLPVTCRSLNSRVSSWLVALPWGKFADQRAWWFQFNMMSKTLLFLCLLSTSYATLSAKAKASRDDCLPCNPDGALDAGGPSLGADLKNLYVDVLETVEDIHFRKRSVPRSEAGTEDFCCQSNLDCVTVVNYNLAICYDKFTTHYAFPGTLFPDKH